MGVPVPLEYFDFFPRGVGLEGDLPRFPFPLTPSRMLAQTQSHHHPLFVFFPVELSPSESPFSLCT